jgi:hypothetical protein
LQNNTTATLFLKPDRRSILWRVLSFPRVINEKAARTVAAVVALTGAIALVTDAHWLMVPLAYGFWARVLTGPRLSPLAQLATKVVAPRLGPPRDVPGPPKRFAQGMGAAMTTLGVLALALGWTAVVTALLALLVAAATLEAALGLCVGCKVFAGLMRAGIIPETVCVECADISGRLQSA